MQAEGRLLARPSSDCDAHMSRTLRDRKGTCLPTCAPALLPQGSRVRPGVLDTVLPDVSSSWPCSDHRPRPLGPRLPFFVYVLC